MNDLANKIEQYWNNKDQIDFTDIEVKQNIDQAVEMLDSGTARIAEKTAQDWQVNQWLKKAILLSFRTNQMSLIAGQTQDQSVSNWYDKVPSKFLAWNEDTYKKANFRAVPGCVVRKGSYIAPNVVLMPSFVNLGAYVDSGTMIDSWATVGSCAQIGKNCHISGGVGIGGVLEPLQANPVIIEDNCFIGARSEVAEGVIVGEGSVISMGVYLGQSTKIYNRDTDEVTYGKIPPYSVVVAGSLPNKDPKKPSLYCAVIVKQVDAKTRSKTSINDLLRA
jgi:2,3,4,5-tetrahydropyridine-2-carboxylate N-succinyltransferase